MKKFVLKLDLQDNNKDKRKALKTVSTLPGIDSIAMDMKERKLTVIGSTDPVTVVSKLRKFWPTTDIISVGPAKEPEKKEEPKKDEAKKEEPKKEETKEEAKKEEPPKEEAKKEEAKKEETKDEKKKEAELAPPPQVPLPLPYRPPPQYYHPQMPYRPYYPPVNTNYYVPQPSIEENPNACVIS